MVYTRKWPMCSVPEGYGNMARIYFDLDLADKADIATDARGMVCQVR